MLLRRAFSMRSEARGVGLSIPTTGMVFGCAPAGCGHATVAPSPAIRSRRLVCREGSMVGGDGGRFTTPPPSRWGPIAARAANRVADSMTSSRAALGWAVSSPSPRAALRLITNSNLVGCSIGNSPGLAPLRICLHRLPLGDTCLQSSVRRTSARRPQRTRARHRPLVSEPRGELRDLVTVRLREPSNPTTTALELPARSAKARSISSRLRTSNN